MVPKKVAFDYISQPEYKAQMQRLFDSGNFVNPLNYSVDNGFMRKLRLYKNQHRHHGNFAKYYK